MTKHLEIIIKLIINQSTINSIAIVNKLQVQTIDYDIII